MRTLVIMLAGLLFLCININATAQEKVTQKKVTIVYSKKQPVSIEQKFFKDMSANTPVVKIAEEPATIVTGEEQTTGTANTEKKKQKQYIEVQAILNK